MFSFQMSRNGASLSKCLWAEIACISKIFMFGSCMILQSIFTSKFFVTLITLEPNIVMIFSNVLTKCCFSMINFFTVFVITFECLNNVFVFYVDNAFQTIEHRTFIQNHFLEVQIPQNLSNKSQSE